MNWNIIIAVTIFIADVILAWFCYTLGCRTVKPIEDNNQKLWEERKLLKKDIDTLDNIHQNLVDEITNFANEINSMQDQLFSIEKEKKLIEESNKQAQEFIAQSEQLAKEKAEAIYEKRYAELKQEYKARYIDLHSILEQNENLIKEQEDELKSLQETRAAAITAARQEKHIQENKDFYCLILPQEELGDVNILRGVAKQISKPRSILMAIWQAYYQPLAKKKFPQILGKTDVCGIYKITNQETGECYIGQAVDVRKRWYEHSKFMLQIDAPKNNQLYAAAAEYGLDSFSFELLLECKPEELNAKEKIFYRII